MRGSRRRTSRRSWAAPCACSGCAAKSRGGIRRAPRSPSRSAARSLAVLQAAADKDGGRPGPAPAARRAGDTLTGRGVSYSYRNQTVVAEIAEVEVNRKTGRVWVKRLVCAHDCGLVINPEALRRTIEGGMLHSISRALYEEVAFDSEKVLSADWVTHPSLTHMDAPAQIDIVMVNGDPNPNR